MTDSAELRVQVQPVPDGDLEELAALTGRLCAELFDLDVVAVVPTNKERAPEGAKGLAAVTGWLVVRFGSVDGLRTVLGTVRGWAQRTGYVVEVSLGGDVLKVTGVTSEQQEKIIDDWLARHAAGS